MIKDILHELKIHSPFTLFGSMTGIILMMIFKDLPYESTYNLFYVFHPLHIILSAIVTTALFCRYQPKKSIQGLGFLKVLLVGYVGAVGVGTLSDSLIPFWGEKLLNMPHAHAHIGFIEKWWLINPLVIGAIVFAYFKPFTKAPHAGHVLISTWASLFHMLMAQGPHQDNLYFGMFIFLFLAVWFPCCLSDIIFPLLFTKNKEERPKGCSCPF